MSLEKLVMPELSWAEFVHILSMLTLRELWLLGCTNRSAFVTFLREKSYREGRGGRSISRSPCFLFKSSLHSKAVLVSYPRSGNSFMRKVLERETGIITGSDSRPNRTLSASLLRFGYAGEGVTDQSVWIVKSHYPERLGYLTFPVSQVILLVRNPFDSIQSYFHMGMTNTHDKNLTKESFEILKEVWDEFVAHEANIWVQFHKFWLDQMDSVNILILRYEDMLQDENSCVEEVMRFLRQGRYPVGLSRYLPHCVDDGSTSPGVGYKSRNKTVGKALDVMTYAQVLKVVSVAQPYMDLFGYKINYKRDNALMNGDKEKFQLDVTSWPVKMMEKVSSPIYPKPSIIINDHFTVRSNDDKFGRKITELRKSFTANDTKQFQVN